MILHLPVENDGDRSHDTLLAWIILTGTGNPLVVVHDVHFTRWVMVAQFKT